MLSRLWIGLVAVVLVVGVIPAVSATSLAGPEPLPLPPLPYAYNALSPVVSETALRTHHTKHHQTYTDRTNAAFTEARRDPTLARIVDQGIEYTLTQLDKFPPALATQIRNQGGGYYNHAFFWRIMRSPREGNMPNPSSRLATAINQTFGSFENFKEQFSTSAIGVFGSGWSWLYLDPSDKKLYIMATPNQDTPISKGYVPLLTNDVWEHAYYLDYQSRRPDYVNSWWSLVNWPVVETAYDQAMRPSGPARPNETPSSPTLAGSVAAVVAASNEVHTEESATLVE